MSAGGRRGDRRRRPGDHAVRPALHRRPGADPVPAAHLRRAPAPGAAEDPDQGRAGRRVRRRPRGPPHRAAARLRRRRGQPVPGAGERRGPVPARPARRRHARQGGQEHRVRAGQGRAQGDEQDGHLHRRLLPRRAGLRRVRHRTRSAGRVLHRHHHPHRRQRPGHHRRRRRGPARAGLRAQPRARWSTASLEIGGQYQWRREGEIHLFNPETVYLLQHSTRSKQEKVFRRYTDAVDKLSREGGTLRGLFELRTGERPAVAAGRGRAGVGDRQAVRHRRDVLRVDLHRGAPDAGHRDEPARRQVEHRRGRRGRRPAARPGAPLGDQAGRVRPVRGDQRLPGERRGDPDQDGAGRQARRGRAAARQQGLPVDRGHPARHRRASG